MDTYWWITFRTNPEQLELDQDGLFEFGAMGVEELEDNQNSAPDKIVLKACFATEASQIQALEGFKARMDLCQGQEKIEDWDRSWRDRQTQLEVTPELVVVPPWVEPKGDFKQVIRLEAKMAFGTGSHETTRIAALLMEKLPCRNAQVLDIGTGTGLLALYAGLLGARRILALDIDPVVGPCLKENLELNPMPIGCHFQTLIGETGALGQEEKFDLILCNMIRTELWPFREELRSRLRPGGHFVVSGQRLEDRKYFDAWKLESPFQIMAELELDGWWGFSARVD